MRHKRTVLMASVAFAAMAAGATTIFDTLPGDDQAGLLAECGQTWMTGSLGVDNRLKTIEVATRMSGAGGGDVHVAVYENKAATGTAANWSKGNLVAVSSNPQNLSNRGGICKFQFRHEKLSDNTRYFYTFVDTATNGVNAGVAVRLKAGNGEQSAYARGACAFSGAHAIASRITTGSAGPLRFLGATVIQPHATVADVGIHGVAALEITSSGSMPTNFLSRLTYNLNGTTDPSDIEEILLYSGHREFDRTTAVLLATQKVPDGPSGVFSIHRKIAEEKEYLWVAVKLRNTSTAGDILDAEITDFSLTGGNAGVYGTAVAAPPEFLTVDPTALYSVVLRRRGDDGYADGFRIPGLAVTPRGTLIASFDARIDVGDLPGDMDTGIMRSTDGGITWEPMRIVMDYDASVPGSRGNGVGDPAILVDPVNGRIWVAALWSFGNNGWFGSGPGLMPKDTGQLVLSYSDDDGLTWSEPVSITRQIKDPAWRLYFQGPGKGLCTREGILIFPTQYKDARGVARSNFIWSGDRGVTWHHGAPAVASGSPQTSEAQAVELANGNLLLSMRDESKPGKRLWCVYSWDHETETIADGSWGATWQELDDPTVMASVERYTGSIDGRPWMGLLFSNPDNPRRRAGMTVRLSLNEGAAGSWIYKRKIDDRFAAYSCLAMLPDGDIGILYESTDGKPTLEYVRFPLEWLVGDGDGMTDFEEEVRGRM